MFADADECAHLLGPGFARTIGGDHTHHGRGGEKRMAITAQPYAAPRRASQTVLALVSVPLKLRVRAEEAEIVQRLDCRYILVTTGGMDGRRQAHPEIVDVRDVRAELAA